MRSQKLEENEGAVYVCEWRSSRKTYQMQILGRPEWSAGGRSFEEAEANILEVIEDATGDMQPCLEYKPEPPKAAVCRRFARPGIVAVSGGNDPLDHMGDLQGLFSGGVCAVCRRGIGKRTNAPLAIERPPRKSDGGFVRLWPLGPFGSMSVQVFSASFIEALATDKRARFEWVRVESKGRSEQPFYEPLSPPLAEKVMPRGLFSEAERLQPDGFHCQHCGRKELTGIPQGGAGLYTFISLAAIPDPPPPCFQIGQPGALEFCMTSSRWAQMVGKRGTSRLLSRQVGVVPRRWINCSPLLEPLPRASN
jgi:hypothetical protein